jgi:hypothetical protein
MLVLILGALVLLGSLKEFPAIVNPFKEQPRARTLRVASAQMDEPNSDFCLLFDSWFDVSGNRRNRPGDDHAAANEHHSYILSTLYEDVYETSRWRTFVDWLSFWWLVKIIGKFFWNVPTLRGLEEVDDAAFVKTRCKTDRFFNRQQRELIDCMLRTKR